MPRVYRDWAAGQGWLASPGCGSYHRRATVQVVQKMLAGSIAAIVTPMRANGDVDYGAFRELVRWHARSGSTAVVVAGTTGEAPTLSKGEILQLIEAAREESGDFLGVMAGCGGNSTAHTMATSRSVVEAGAEACLVVTPYYNRPTQRGLYEHFVRVAEAAGRSVVLYNVPSRTGCDLLPETVGRLSEHPLIHGIKEATGNIDRGSEVLAASVDGFVLLSGDDGSFVELMEAGAKGVISVTANVAPRAMADICEYALADKFGEARQRDARLQALHRALMIESNPIPVKWLLSRMGKIDETLRLPLTPLDSDCFGAVNTAAAEAGIELALRVS